MKGTKKRRPGSNGSSVRNHGVAMKQTHKHSKGDKMHVLSIFDELDGYLAPNTPEIHRVHIPAAGERGELFRKGAIYLNNVDGTTVNWGVSGDEELVETCDVFSDGGLPGLDMTLSPEALQGPRPDFVEGLEKLLEAKFGIMALRIRHGLDAWSLGSQMVNPFEVLSYVAATSPLNRAFFKMWELIQTFQLVPSVSKKQRFLSAHLCEGPGGFIEAVLDYRARSSISKEGTQEISEVVDGEVHTRVSSSPLLDGTEAHRKSRSDNPFAAAPLRSLALNGGNGSEDLSYRPTISNTSGNNIDNLQYSCTEVNGSGATPKLGSGSPCPAERSSVEVGNQMPTSGCTRADLQSNNRSRTHSRQVNQHFELDRAGSRDVDQFATSCETTPFSTGARDAWMDPLTLHQSGAVRGQELAGKCPSLGSFVKVSKDYHDLWFGQTLASTQQCATTGGSPPPMMELTKLNEKVAGKSEGHLHFGVDGSGDLTNSANLNAFVEYTLGRSDGQRMELITADGAFDVSEDFSSQEHSHLNLVFCEVVAALRLQADGGSFVLKLFDCYTASTLTILFILSSLYCNVEIVRLRTTRVCNSERYVVAEGFLGLSPKLEDTLLRLNEEWHIASRRGDKVGLLLSGGFPEELLQAVMESNAVISAMQMDGINRALQLADVIGARLPASDSFGKRKGSISMLRRKLQTQKRMQRNAIALCNALNIPCRSQFSGASAQLPPRLSRIQR